MRQNGPSGNNDDWGFEIEGPRKGSSVKGIEEERIDLSGDPFYGGKPPEASSRLDLSQDPFYTGFGGKEPTQTEPTPEVTGDNPLEGAMFWGPKIEEAKKYATTFLVGGITDTLGLAAGGVAGLTDLAMGKDMEEAQQTIEGIAGWASENVTMKILGPLAEPGEYERIHNNVGEAFATVMQGAGDLAENTIYKVPLTMLEAAGQDTTKVRAALHAHTQASLAAAMFALGGRGGERMGKQRAADEARIIDLPPSDWNIIMRESVKGAADIIRTDATRAARPAHDPWADAAPGSTPPPPEPPPTPGTEGLLRLTKDLSTVQPRPRLLEDRSTYASLRPLPLDKPSTLEQGPIEPTYVRPLSEADFHALREDFGPYDDTHLSHFPNAREHAGVFDRMDTEKRGLPRNPVVEKARKNIKKESGEVPKAGRARQDRGSYEHYLNLIDDLNVNIDRRMAAYEQAIAEDMGANMAVEPVTGAPVPGEATPFGPQRQALNPRNAAHRRAIAEAVASTAQRYSEAVRSARELVSGSEVDPAAAGIFALRSSLDLSNEAIFKMAVSKLLFKGMETIGPEQAKGRNMQELQSLMDRMQIRRQGNERLHELQNLITEKMGWEAQYRPGPDGQLVRWRRSPLSGAHESVDASPGKPGIDLSYTSLLEPISDVSPLPRVDPGHRLQEIRGQGGIQKYRTEHQPSREEQEFSAQHGDQLQKELVPDPKTGQLVPRDLQGFDVLAKPDMDGPRQRVYSLDQKGPYDTFNFREKLVLHRVLNTLREAIYVPDHGMLIQLKGEKPIRQQAVELWGEAGKQFKEGALTEGGEFLSPAHVKLLRQLAHRAITQDTPLTLTHMVPGWEKYVEKAFMSYAEPVVSRHRAYNRLITLEDAGMRGTGAKKPVASGPPVANLDRVNRRAAERQRLKGLYEGIKSEQEKAQKFRDTVNEARVKRGKAPKEESEFNLVRGKDVRWVKPKVPYDKPTVTKKPTGGFDESQSYRDTGRDRDTDFLDPNRPISSKTPWDRQRGAVGFGFIRALDSLIRRYQRRVKEGKPYNRPDSTVRVGAGFTPWQHTKLVAGGQAMGPHFDRLAIHLHAGRGVEYGRLLAMVDQLPQHLATEHTANIPSYHQVRQMWYGEYVTSTSNGKSVYSIWDKHSAKLLTGPRRIAGALPGGKHVPGTLTMARVKPRLEREAFLDLTSGAQPRTALGKDIRKWFDDMYNLAVGVGVTPHARIEGYYPPYFNKAMQRANSRTRKQFVALAEKKGLSRQSINNALDMIMDGEGLMTIKPTAKREGDKTRTTSKRLEQERQFLRRFSVRELQPFLADNLYGVMIKYAQETLDRLAVAERYGPNDEIWLEQLDRAAREAKEIGWELGEKEIDHLYDVRNMTTHTYKTGHRWFNNFQRKGIAVMNWSLLGMVVPGSIMEPALGLINPTFRGAYAQTWGHSQLPRFIRSAARAVWRGVEPDVYVKLASDVGRGVDAAIHEHLTAMSAADKGSTFSNLAFTMNGQHALTNGMIYAGTESFIRTLKEVTTAEAMHRLGKGRKATDVHKADVAALEYYGLNINELLKWQKEGMSFDGSFYRNKVQAGLIKYLFDAVLTPRGSNIAPWMNNSTLAAMAHLMSYVSMMGNKVTPDLWHQLRGNLYKSAPNTFAVKSRARVAAMGALMALLGLSVLSEEMMDVHKYGGSDKHPLAQKFKDDTRWSATQVARYFNRSGMGGLPAAKVFDIYEAIQYKQLKGPDLTGAVIGPLWSTILDLSAGSIAAFHGEGLTAKQLAHMFVKDMPVPMMSAMPKKKQSPSARLLGSKEALQKDLENWLISQGFPRGGKSSSRFGGRGYYGKSKKSDYY